MCCVFEFLAKVGRLSFKQDEQSFTKPYSEATAQLIDDEVCNFSPTKDVSLIK
jgi:ATP-dependent Zn protease